MYSIKKIVIGLCIGFTAGMYAESFIVEPGIVEPGTETAQKNSKKKKKSLTTLRAECIDVCENLAHSMLQEIQEVSRLLMQWARETGECDSGNFLYMRAVEIQRQSMYLATGKMPMLKMRAPYELRQENAAVVLESLAGAQERIMVTVKAMLMTDSEHVFVKAHKKELEKYNKEIETFIVESGMFVSKLQDLQKKAKKQS